MPDETSDDGFAVGYKKPPQHSRFQPGRSGNPRGKQKGVRNLGSDVKRTLEVPVRLTEQGRARRVGTPETAPLRLREKAPQSERRSRHQPLELAKNLNKNGAGCIVSDGGGI